MTADEQRVTLNSMVQVDGLGRAPTEKEMPTLGKDWRERIPADDDELPVGYPFVEFKDRTFAEMLTAQSGKLQAAADEIEATMGIGSWRVLEESGMACGPDDPNGPHGNTIGSSATVRIATETAISDEQFFEVMNIMDKHFPGIADPANQVRVNDQPGHRTYRVVSDRDDSLQISYKTEAGNIIIGLYSGCYLTNGS